MESLEHLEHPERALGELRRRCKKLVIRVNTCEAGPRRLFAGSMPMQTTTFYLNALERTGWIVTHVANRRSESLRNPFEWLARTEQSGYGRLRRPAHARIVGVFDFLRNEPLRVCGLSAHGHRRRVKSPAVHSK